VNAFGIEGDVAATTTNVLTELGLTEEAQRVLAPALRGQIHEMLRSRTRAAERKAFTPAANGNINRTEMRARLANEYFALGSGRFVHWLDATVEDHRERIGLLDTVKRGIDATIGRHEIAIRMIERHGVGCLRDLPERDREALAA